MWGPFSSISIISSVQYRSFIQFSSIQPQYLPKIRINKTFLKILWCTVYGDFGVLWHSSAQAHTWDLLVLILFSAIFNHTYLGVMCVPRPEEHLSNKLCTSPILGTGHWALGTGLKGSCSLGTEEYHCAHCAMYLQEQIRYFYFFLNLFFLAQIELSLLQRTQIRYSSRIPEGDSFNQSFFCKFFFFFWNK
jgi:hypothetical protein